MREDEVLCQKCTGFYVFPVVVLQQIRCMDVICWLPCVITFGVSLPFDEVLQGMTAPNVPVVLNGFNFIFCFSFNKI
jgi:hypothetical protein